ncbi:hypothetical protein GNI_136400 [Gregarina niphandrodes]|uniref:Uncharacterized protein n=1 Tax=Gregarina niphandrodes TaxID=110365 RepID=A0A023B1G5_GRENI|nr:hypothetical protein GNI_136400 [Gregarina niphandrodes]EZG45900.1 hypothetical protein GNI_136400 [Gregarina niphandrodes]|eukprot:XP_011132426.1 hypothetical protein GNI_136400 [Gregarina niphandrodes]
MFLQQYDLKFSYNPGDNNYVVDALSRLQADEDRDRDLDAMHIGTLPSHYEFLVKDDDIFVGELQNLRLYEHRKTERSYVPTRLRHQAD